MVILDTGLTLAELLAETIAERQHLGPSFKFTKKGDALALLNMFASFK